jgi:NTE family protein
MTQFKNLVFKGGGVRGLAYIGAAAALEDKGLIAGVRRTCGTSSGAVVAAHLALGGQAWQLAEIMTSRFLGGLLDGSVWPVRNLQRLIRDFGWFHGKHLSVWMKRHVEYLSGVSNLTFAGLERLQAESPRRFKQLTVIATNVTLQCPQVYSSQETPDMPVWEALRASMSIPLLFAALRDESGDIFVDGALTWNYPITYYDDFKWLSLPTDPSLYSVLNHPSDRFRRCLYNKETLGLMAETRGDRSGRCLREAGSPEKIGSFATYLRAMLGLMTDNATSPYLNLPDWQRTVFIEAHGVRATDFSLSDSKIAGLIDSGRQAALDYLDWFENPENTPLNRIESIPGVD